MCLSGPLRPIGALGSPCWVPLLGPKVTKSRPRQGWGLRSPLTPHCHKSSSEQQQSSHGNTCVFYIFPPKRWVFKYSSSTICSAKAARVYDGSLLLKALK